MNRIAIELCYIAKKIWMELKFKAKIVFEKYTEKKKEEGVGKVSTRMLWRCSIYWHVRSDHSGVVPIQWEWMLYQLEDSVIVQHTWIGNSKRFIKQNKKRNT